MEKSHARRQHPKPGGAQSGKALIVMLVAFAAGVLALGAFGAAIEYTGTNQFCGGACHSMEIPLEEYQDSTHYSNSSGFHATCADCHIPKELGPKLYRKMTAGVRDVYHTILGTIDTPEKYEARRWEMANAVWARMRANDSRECRNCHDPQKWDLEEQDRQARRKHKPKELEEQTCVDCHTGVAHAEPIEPEGLAKVE